jgi:hypothetical protein
MLLASDSCNNANAAAACTMTISVMDAFADSAVALPQADDRLFGLQAGRCIRDLHKAKRA